MPQEQSHAAAYVPARPVPTIAPAEPEQWQTVIPLERSLTVDGQLLNVITVRCLTGDEFVHVVMTYGTSEDVLMPEIRAAMCGVHPSVIAALAADDQARVVAACRPFYPRQLRGDPDETDIVAAGLVAAMASPT